MELSRVKRRHGFTLIELLVVIAIIAILAAILFPVFAQAREKARQSACLNNTKQMGTAVYTYMSDWDEYYPASTAYNPPNYTFGFWMHQILPYLTTWDVFRCPSSPHERPGGLPANLYPVANYSYNEYIMYGPYYASNSPNMEDFSNAAAITDPVATALISDGFNASLFHDWGNNEDSNTDYNLAPDKMPLPSGMLRMKYANGNVGGVLQSRHSGANIVFCDTHAKHIKLERFYCEGGPNRPVDPRQRVQFPVIHPWAKAP